MKKIIVLLISLFFLSSAIGQLNIYSFKIDSITGNNKIDFAAFQGKIILIVNTATEDSCSSQFNELEQLYQLYRNNLVVVAVSSNSFNTEPRSNSQIANYCLSNYNIHFPLSSKINVAGSNTDTLYKWLTQKALNTLSNSTVFGGFQKYLINKQGKLIGVFSRKLSPMDAKLRQVIESL